jgi:hypothetical protein
MYRVTVECQGLAQSLGDEAAEDIERESGSIVPGIKSPYARLATGYLRSLLKMISTLMEVPPSMSSRIALSLMSGRTGPFA